MALNFRPGNIYSKGTLGDRAQNSGVLLRVKIRRRKNEVITENVEIVGHTIMCYRFTAMCDYEMLPLAKRTPDATHAELFYKDICPSIHSTLEEWLTTPRPMPYYFPPSTFTRFENSATDRKLFRAEEQSMRVKRYLRDAIRLEFNLNDLVPTTPSHELCFKRVTREEVELIREKFVDRPIWSTTALHADMPNFGWIKIKYILPHIGYYYNTGPWRNMWIRFGYDPRKEFESRKYQLMDLRLNQKAMINIKTRREKSRQGMPSQVKNNVVSQLVYDENETVEEREVHFPIFSPNYFHQLGWVNFYQYCDIEVPRIQEMLEKVPSPVHGAKISEKTGWLPQGFDEQCRDILCEILKEYFQMEMQAKSTEDENAAELAMEADEEIMEDDDADAFDED